MTDPADPADPAGSPASPGDTAGSTDPAGTDLSQSTTWRERADDQLRYQGASGLVALTVLVLVLLRWTGLADPGAQRVRGCDFRFNQLTPFDAGDALAAADCRTGGLLGTYLERDWWLIAAYSVLFVLTVRWLGAIVFRSGVSRVQAGAGLIPGVADVTENLLLANGSAGSAGLLAAATGIKLGAFVGGSVLTLGALAVGLRGLRFIFTRVPPTNDDPGTGVVQPEPTVSSTSRDDWYRIQDSDTQDLLPPDQTTSLVDGPVGRYGIGLSGGGIRSAAFSLGFLSGLTGSGPQGPTHPWRLTTAKHLATVSGGGFVGVSAQLLSRSRAPEPVSPDPYSAGAPEVEFVADHAKYLGRGVLGGLRVVLIWVLGVAFNLFVVGGLLLALGALIGWPARVDPRPPEQLSALGWGALATLAVSAVLWQLATPDSDLEPRAGLLAPGTARIGRIVAPILLVVGSVTAIASVDLLGPVDIRAATSWLPVVRGWTTTPLWAASSLVALSVVLLVLVAQQLLPAANEIGGPPPRLAVFLRMVVNAASSAALFAVAGAVAQLPILVPAFDPAGAPRWWIGVGAVLAVVMLTFDQTNYSPHRFYKRQIAATFALKRVSPSNVRRWPPKVFSYLDPFAVPVGGPELLVCATANTYDKSLPPAGSRAVPFVFSATYVGSPELGSWTAEDFRRCLGRRLAGDGTLQAAGAISGAAVASGLGRYGRLRSTGPLLALVNARLGVWLPNPNARPAARTWPAWGSRWGVRTRRPTWLLREVLGALPSRARYVYVSDGGHLDNLGLLELVRRRCDSIVLVDATTDRALTTGTFDASCRLAADHLGVTITAPDRRLVGPDGKTRSPVQWTDCVWVSTVHYPQLGAAPAKHGVIILAKAVFAETIADDPDAQEAAAIATSGWPRIFPWSARNVPRVSTVNQFLTERQYRGLRLLGQAVAHRLPGAAADQRRACSAPDCVGGIGGPRSADPR